MGDVEIAATESKDGSRDDRNVDDSIFSVANADRIYLQEMREKGWLNVDGLSQLSEIRRRRDQAAADKAINESDITETKKVESVGKFYRK